jgi:hypothetical protein
MNNVHEYSNLSCMNLDIKKEQEDFISEVALNSQRRDAAVVWRLQP